MERKCSGVDGKDRKMQNEKDLILQILSTMPEEVLKVALSYAQNYTLYGVDVTKAWETALEQSAALNQAYKRGYAEGFHEGMK